jgi:WD repeat and SOF domain-containing protein 1
VLLLSIRHRHVPKAIKKAAEAKRVENEREKQKTANRRAHAKPGAVPFTNAREKAIIRELE